MVSPTNRVTMECPFDLEAVFTLQYSTEGLKGVLQWIIENLGGVKGDLSNLEERFNARCSDIEA